jgi:hypothetical protein
MLLHHSHSAHNSNETNIFDETTTMMKRSLLSIALCTGAYAFLPAQTGRPSFVVQSSASHTINDDSNTPEFVDVAEPAPKRSKKKAYPAVKTRKAAATQHKEGPFAPLVHLTKQVLGEEELNKVRAKVISQHSDVIKGFVDTSDSAFGNAVLKQLFHAVDKNGDGTVDERELRQAFQILGFDWLKDKQVQGILQRADENENGVIDLEEWMREAPKTLRTNLVKLAKKNGGELGFLV